MALFNRDPEKKLQQRLSSLRQERVNSVARLEATQASIPELEGVVTQLIKAAAAEDDLCATEGKLHAAQKRIASCDKAIVEIDAEIEKIEKDLAAIADEKMRRETAAQIDVLTKEFEADGIAAIAAINKWTRSSQRAAELVLESHALTAFLMSAAAETPAAAEMVTRELRSRAQATIAGTAPATLPKTPPVLVETPKPTPQLRSYFVLQPGTFSDAAGTMRRAPRYSFVELNPQQAAHAIRMKGVCEPTDQRVKQMRKQQATQQPPPEHVCQNWDNGAAPRGDAELVIHSKFIQSSPFMPLDRGQPYTMAIQARPAVGTRAEDENE